MDPHSSRFDNPELAGGAGLGKRAHQGLGQNTESGEKVSVPKDVGEIQIHRHQGAGFRPAADVQGLIIDPRKTLVADRGDLVTRLTQ